ncbi:MAG: FAD-binding oxidoreductase [Gammaproteobacteria bacterium]|nr:FAD-binding oxidoreductase [Gammaproteobacteria bacterium]
MIYNRRQLIKLLSHATVAGACYPLLAGCTTDFRAPRASADFAALADRFNGTVLLPASKNYDSSRRTFSFNPRTDRRPAAIAACKNEFDVATAVEFARANELEIAVRSGGHDVLAASTCNDGLLIDLAELNSIQLDANRALAITGPGASAGMLDRAMADRGRMLALGCNPQVGVAGLTLGGGLGWFAGSLGATCDNLQRVRVVTADGRIVTASETENPDLLWALRGGGGNFGIVVELGLVAHPLDTVTGGYLCFDGGKLPEFLRFYRDYMAAAPDSLDVEVAVMAPSRRLIVVMTSVLGDADKARQVLAPLRAFDKPLADGLRTVPYPGVVAPTNEVSQLFRPDSNSADEPNDAPGIQWLGGSLGELDDATIATIVEQVERARGGWAFNVGHHMHGAVCRTPAADSPLPRPRGTFTYHFATWWGSAASAPARMAWVDGAVDAMRKHETAAYVNYLSTDHPAAVERAYGANYARLQDIKRQYDPDNIFHRNRNIEP